MNSRQKTELQRKLTLNAVPTPPAGLAERIKAGIPHDLGAGTEGTPFPRAGLPGTFTMRIAAAALLVVSSLLATLFVVDRNQEPTLSARATGPQPGPFAPAPRRTSESILPRSTTATTSEVRLEIEQEAALPGLNPPSPVFVPERVVADAASTPAPPAQMATGNARGHAEGFLGEEVFAPEPAREERSVMKPEAPVTSAAPEPQMARSVAPEKSAEDDRARRATASSAFGAATDQDRPPAAAAKALRRQAMAPAAAPAPAPLAITRDAQAAEISLEPARQIFGIAVDPQLFSRIRATLESGGRPAASAVDVGALVNHFTGVPAARPRKIRLEVEASPAVLESPGDHAILRFTIDTPAPVTSGGSTTPVATDAAIEIEMNERFVSSARRVGGPAVLSSEPVLHPGTSVTGLYALELNPNLRASDLLATVRLRYTDVTNGRRRMLEKKILAGQLPKSWAHASHRHRLASLGALWGETLKGNAGASAVAQKAKELVTEDPNDPLVRALAAAASRSANSTP